MNKSKNLLFATLALVLLLGGAYILYGRLSQEAAPEQLSVMGGQVLARTEPEKETEHPPQDREASDPYGEEEAAAVQAEDAQQENTEPERISAPDFTVYDPSGNETHLMDYIGKPIVLNFWASWCGPCQREMPDFNEAYAELGGDVQFLMVNITSGRETLESATSFIEEQGYSFPVFYDTEADAAVTYGVYSLPTTYFIDSEGYIIAQATGTIDRETLQKGIDMILQQ